MNFSWFIRNSLKRINPLLHEADSTDSFYSEPVKIIQDNFT